jgi:hypothetical protein
MCFQIDDLVRSDAYGDGIVMAISNNNEEYPVQVFFYNAIPELRVQKFTTDGKHYIYHVGATLFHRDVSNDPLAIFARAMMPSNCSETALEDKYMTGIYLIAAERLRQVYNKGKTLSHDASYVDGELAWAACYYAVPKSFMIGNHSISPVDFFQKTNWYTDSAKRNQVDRIQQLIIAGAFIAAEIDRLTNTNTEHCLPGIGIIAAEHQRFVKAGYSQVDDDGKHVNGELAWLACYYAMPDVLHMPNYSIRPKELFFMSKWPHEFAICRGFDRIKQLAFSGDFIASEIDRLLIRKRMKLAYAANKHSTNNKIL